MNAKAHARARANIALIKYWGKAEPSLNIPAVGSISITLDKLWSDTQVRFDEDLAADQLSLDGQSRPEQLARASKIGKARRSTTCDALSWQVYEQQPLWLVSYLGAWRQQGPKP